MKVKYTKLVSEGVTRKAGYDSDMVTNWELFEMEEGNVLVLSLGLTPVDTYTEVPRRNGKGAINGYESKKVLDVPKIYLTLEEDIEAFLAQWV